jgi:hypothetical protein
MWLRQLAVAVGYVTLYEAEHPFSQPQFLLISATRLICLLLLPYRYWPALAVGEFLTNGMLVYECVDQFGLLWASVRIVPPIFVVMPIVWWCRERLALFPTKHLVDIKALLVCILASSLALSAHSYLTLSLANVPPGDAPHHPLMALGYFTGNYFASLALVPWALIARFECRMRSWREAFNRITESRLPLIVMLSALILLFLVGYGRGDRYQQLILMAMLIPILLLTLRYGWRGAAFSGTITIICAAIVVPSQRADASMTVIQSELLLAFVTTGLIALGARISEHLMHDRQRLQQALNAQRLARHSYHQGEHRQRQTAQAIERILTELHLADVRWLQLNRLVINVDGEPHYQRSLDAQLRLAKLAESLHPIAWRARGLPAALKETIGDALDMAGVAYHCNITGRGFTAMHPVVLTAVYRAACEAIVHVSARSTCSDIRLTVRGGETRRARRIFIGIEGSFEEGKTIPIEQVAVRRCLADKLGAYGFDLEQLREHARLFGGQMHYRADSARVRIALLMYDAHPTESPWQKHAGLPMRLWVQ